MKRLALAMLVVLFLLVLPLRAGSKDNSFSRASDELKKAEQLILKMQAEKKLQWKLQQMEGTEAKFPDVDLSLCSQVPKTASGAGSISGLVTNASGVGIQNILVRIYDPDWNYFGYVATNASGNYMVSGLPAGTFKVFFDRNGQNYVSEWYKDKGDFDEADQIVLTAGSTAATINAQLAASGSISGRVTNASGVGIQYIAVFVYDLNNNYLTFWNTDASGYYTVSGLPVGNLKVYFNNNYRNYLPEWYNEKSDFVTADPVAVIADSTTPNINAQLTTGAQISGRVTNASGVGIQNVQIRVYDLGNNSVGTINSDANGNYTVSGLPGGNLKVFFDKASQNYISEWYNDKDTFNTADPVAVTAGSATTNINAQLAMGGQISGQVTDVSAVGIQNIYAIVYDLDWQLIGFKYTDASGNYTVTGLPAGNFKVFFYNNHLKYISEWYNNKSDFSSADPVAVTTGSTTSHINMQLEKLVTSGSLTIIAPNGGESWKVGEDHDITWSSTGSIANVNIDYSTDNGGSWTPLVVDTANDGSCTWVVSDTPSAFGLVRVSNSDGVGADSSDAVFTIWTDIHTISGTITCAGSPLANVIMNGLPGDPGSPSTDINGHYSAKVPDGWSGTVTPTHPYYAFSPASTTYTNVTASQTTNYATTLNQSLVVTSPATGSVWEKGRTQTITWLKQGPQNANVKIVLWKDASTLVQVIATATPNDGSYDWTVPATLATGSTYFIKVKTVDNLIYDFSDKFSIIIPAITVTAPTTGTVWAKGTIKTITWNKVGTQDANVKIQLFRGTTKVLDITASTPNSGSYDWAIPPTLATALYTVRITTLDGKVKGISKSFTIANGMIRVTAPATGTRWQRGVVYTITWTSEGTVNTNVRIQLLKGDQVAAIAATTPNDGSFDWAIPAGKALANYKIRVTTVDNLVTGDSGIFAITGSAGLVLLSPNGDEILKPTTGQTIRWSVDPDVLEVKLEFSRDNGSTFSTIADHVANTGRYEWLVPVNFTRNGIVRVSDSNGKFWQDDGLLEFSFKFIYGGEGDEAGAVLWFGGSDVNAPGYGFARIALNQSSIQFGGFSKAIEPLAGYWHELRVRFDFRRDTAEIRLDDQPMFENAALNTTREHYFQPCLVVQTGGGAPLDFIVDDLAINVVQPDDSGQDRQVFNVLADDFDRYDERSNALRNCWQLRNVDDKKNKVELDVENGSGKALRLRTAAGKRLVVHLPIALPERVPFDISDKNMTIENQ